jgi:hypothetical protein
LYLSVDERFDDTGVVSKDMKTADGSGRLKTSALLETMVEEANKGR